MEVNAGQLLTSEDITSNMIFLKKVTNKTFLEKSCQQCILGRIFPAIHFSKILLAIDFIRLVQK